MRGQTYEDSADEWVLRNEYFRTVSGLDGSSTKGDHSCAVGVPTLSWMNRKRLGRLRSETGARSIFFV
jgi:hypothetical protein